MPLRHPALAGAPGIFLTRSDQRLEDLLDTAGSTCHGPGTAGSASVAQSP